MRLYAYVTLVTFLSQEVLDDLIELVGQEEVEPDKIIVSFLIIAKREVLNHA